MVFWGMKENWNLSIFTLNIKTTIDFKYFLLFIQFDDLTNITV